jgi:hypothetical protein
MQFKVQCEPNDNHRSMPNVGLSFRLSAEDDALITNANKHNHAFPMNFLQVLGSLYPLIL